jgi:predicted transcriptional regulator of viral defense system
MDAIIEKKILELAQDSAGVSPRDLEKLGIPRQYLYKLYNKGLLERVARGLYSIADSEPSEYRTIAEVCKRIPEGVICLLSALQLHGLTAQMPHQIFHFSGEAFSSGIEERHIEGVMVKVYNPAKTVGDCFKFRNRLGLDVALEALRDCRRQRKCTNDNLYLYAKICRVWNVMKPYMEAIV